MRLYIRQKIFLLGFGLTFVLIILAFVTSFFTYKNRVEKKYDETIQISLDVASDWFSDLRVSSESYSTEESRSDVFNYIVNTYKKYVSVDEKYPDGSNEEELYKYLLSSYPDLYPAASSGLIGMSRTGPTNRSHHASLKSDLVSTLGIADGVVGYIVYYDKEKDRYVNIVDTNFRFDDAKYSSNMPGSYEKLDEYDHKVIDEIEKNGFYKEGTLITYFIDLKDDAGNLMARIILKYDEAVIVDTIRTFSIILASTLIGISILLVMSYVFFAHLMIVKNIKKLTLTSDKFKEKLLNNEELEIINTNIKAKDEIGNLSESFVLLENEIINYAERIEFESKERERMNAELSVATKIQLESLPKNTLNDENVLINTFIKSAKEVGGDFYDYFYIDDNHLAIIISDVSGKGVPAALFMMKSKELIKSKLLSKKSIEDVCFEANNELLENNEAGLFITAFIGILDITTNVLKLVSAGHEKPYLISEGKAIRLDVKSNFILGGIDNYKYQHDEIKLNDGDRLFLHTDGLNESIDENGIEFGYDRILNCLNDNNKNKLNDILVEMDNSLNSFTNNKEQFDDITMLILELKSSKLEFNYNNPGYEIIEEVTNKFSDYYSYLDKNIVYKACIIIDEILNNYVSYEKKDNLIVKVSFDYIDNKLVIKFENNGEYFDPLKKENKFIENDDNLVSGGLGLTMIKKLSSEVSYERIDNFNKLIVSININDNK